MSLLALEPALLARLRAVLPRTVHVLPAPDLAEVIAGRALTPGVYVIYAGGDIAESRGDGRAVRIRQRWTVLVCVRNAAQITTGTAAREDAGAIADTVLAALLGWAPVGGETKPLALVALPNPGYVAGLQWVPLTFAAELVRREAAQ